MQHWFRSPPSPIVKIVVLGEAASIDDAVMRADARPSVREKLAAVIETCPDKTTGKELSRIVDLPPSFDAKTIAGEIDIVGAGVSFYAILRINSTSGIRARRFRADGRLLWKFCVELVDVLSSIEAPSLSCSRIVESLDIHYLRRAFSEFAIHG